MGSGGALAAVSCGWSFLLSECRNGRDWTLVSNQQRPWCWGRSLGAGLLRGRGLRSFPVSSGQVPEAPRAELPERKASSRSAASCGKAWLSGLTRPHSPASSPVTSQSVPFCKQLLLEQISKTNFHRRHVFTIKRSCLFACSRSLYRACFRS